MSEKEYFAFQWHITEACDQRCKHCYIFAENPEKKLLSMPFDEMQKTVLNIQEFALRFNRIPFIYLTGGDPILHPDFWKLLKLLHKEHIRFGILGNPFHLTDEICDRLVSYGCERYQMSIDGLEQTHDWFRKPGSYRETMAKIPMLRRAGIKTMIMSTVSRLNIGEIPSVADAVVEAGADVFCFARYVPTGSSRQNDIKPLEYKEFLTVMDRKFKTYESDPDCHTFFSRKDHLWTLYQYETGEFKIPESVDPDLIYAGCNCGNNHITILPDGQIYACRRVAESCVGNIRHDQISKVWVERMEAFRDYTAFSKCSKCRLLAWCRGCPAVAKGTSGSFYGEDPQCWRNVT